MKIVFFCFSAFTILAVLNVITGVFVESALRTADNDKKLSLARRLRELFRVDGTKESVEVYLEDFEDNFVHSPVIQTCLKELDIAVDDARELFRLLDIEESGCLEGEEICHGVLRLMGNAKSLDLAVLSKDLRHF